jgi:anti-sigma B factor antagonist
MPAEFPPDPVLGRGAFTRPFECSCTDDTLDAAWVHVAGALDIATSPRLVRTLRECEARLVVLDLRELAIMDCSGVHAIVDASRHARQLGRQLLLLRGPAHVDRVFSLTGHADEVETADLAPVEPSAGSLQRSLVSASLLKTNGHANGGGPSHR